MQGLIRTGMAGLALCGAFAGTLHAANGLLIVEKSSGAGTPSTNQIQIESNRMRVETAGPSGAKQVVIFDGTRGVLMMIDNDRKTYSEITRDEADKLGAQVSDAMAQMKKQMESMPPAQRAQFEEMMKGQRGRAGMAAAPKTVYRKTGKGEVGKWACDRYEGFQGDKKTMEVCTVAPQTLGFTAADFAVSKQLGEFFGNMMPQMRGGQMFALGDAAEQGFEGVPVRRVMTIGGRETISEITDISRQSFPDSSYAAPAGYRKEAFGPAGRGR